MLAGEPDAGNLQVRFDEGEQRDWRKPPVALYSTGSQRPQRYSYADPSEPSGSWLKLTALGEVPVLQASGKISFP